MLVALPAVPFGTVAVELPALVGPGVPVALKVTGLPAKPIVVAVSVLPPAVLPSLQVLSRAIPCGLVVWEGPVMLPPPVATAKVTPTLASAFPAASVTLTVGRAITFVATTPL